MRPIIGCRGTLSSTLVRPTCIHCIYNVVATRESWMIPTPWCDSGALGISRAPGPNMNIQRSGLLDMERHVYEPPSGEEY